MPLPPYFKSVAISVASAIKSDSFSYKLMASPFPGIRGSVGLVHFTTEPREKSSPPNGGLFLYILCINKIMQHNFRMQKDPAEAGSLYCCSVFL
jgi:hypothetical protein